MSPFILENICSCGRRIIHDGSSQLQISGELGSYTTLKLSMGNAYHIMCVYVLAGFIFSCV